MHISVANAKLIKRFHFDRKVSEIGAVAQVTDSQPFGGGKQFLSTDGV